MTDVHPTVPASLRVVYRMFREQQPDTPLFAARCCGRSFVGSAPAASCRTCEKQPQNVELHAEDDLLTMFDTG